jgi:hypothetical protein
MIEMAAADRSHLGATSDFLRKARWYAREGTPFRPDYEAPQALTRTRAALLRLAHGPCEIQRWARDQLHMLSACLDNAIPLEESLDIFASIGNVDDWTDKALTYSDS